MGKIRSRRGTKAWPSEVLGLSKQLVRESWYEILPLQSSSSIRQVAGSWVRSYRLTYTLPLSRSDEPHHDSTIYRGVDWSVFLSLGQSDPATQILW